MTSMIVAFAFIAPLHAEQVSNCIVGAGSAPPALEILTIPKYSQKGSVKWNRFLITAH